MAVRSFIPALRYLIMAAYHGSYSMSATFLYALKSSFWQLLSDNVCIILDRTMHRRKATNLDDRAVFVWKWVCGRSVRTIAYETGSSMTTVSRWIRRWKREGNVNTRPRPGRPCSSKSRLAACPAAVLDSLAAVDTIMPHYKYLPVTYCPYSPTCLYCLKGQPFLVN